MDKNKKCIHGKRRSQCKECGGSSFCEHGRQRHYCKECSGNQMCKHSKKRYYCKECGGAGICGHSKFHYACKVCGASFCEHEKLRITCTRCRPDSTYKTYKRVAKKRELSFELSSEEFKWIVDSPCLRCGESVQPMACDRVDSDKGYSFWNCQPLCNTCNRMKMDSSEEEFDQHIIKMIQHRPELVKRAGFLTKQI